MDQTKETCSITDLIEELEDMISQAPYDDWDCGWNGALRAVIRLLDKYKVEVV